MALTCPIGLDVQHLLGEVAGMYARVATDPQGEFHFHRGARYAIERLGYSEDELDAVPEEAKAAFAGVANPHAIERMRPGETVLDVGSGGGMDLLIAARRVGAAGRAIGVDMTKEMVARARGAAVGLTNVEVFVGSADALPIEDQSVDVVISNGVLNLAPDKLKVFAEIARVLVPGGRLLLGDIVVAAELSEGIRRDIDLWTG